MKRSTTHPVAVRLLRAASHSTLAATLTATLALVTACTTSPTGRTQLMLVSPQAAIVQSKTAYLSTMGEFDKENKLVDDPLLADRVATITGRLVTEAVALYPYSRDWEWSVAIVKDDETVNAWCMAGGRMAAYTGLFEQLKLTDDEFAQIMGHEISHALANHTAERMSRAIAINVGVIAAGVASDSHGVAMAGTALAAKMALELPNSRVAESEADRIGIELASRAGYDPSAAVSLWEKMGGLSEKRPPEFLSTHPSPETRMSDLRELVPEMRALNASQKMAKVSPVTIVR